MWCCGLCTINSIEIIFHMFFAYSALYFTEKEWDKQASGTTNNYLTISMRLNWGGDCPIIFFLFCDDVDDAAGRYGLNKHLMTPHRRRLWPLYRTILDKSDRTVLLDIMFLLYLMNVRFWMPWIGSYCTLIFVVDHFLKYIQRCFTARGNASSTFVCMSNSCWRRLFCLMGTGRWYCLRC